MQSTRKIVIILTIFSIAMGFMESAIVVYLRALYYPGGFDFPLVPLDNNILITELFREAATLIMLVTIGLTAGRTKAENFVFFLFCFAVWDIFYYVFLKLLLNWPASLFTWDILFLLPVPWVGPVLAPVILSLTMIALTFMVLHQESKGYTITFRLKDWILLIAGSLIIIFSFTQDYINIMIDPSSSASPEAMIHNLMDYIPQGYNWWIFVIGEAIILTDLVLIYRASLR